MQCCIEAGVNTDLANGWVPWRSRILNGLSDIQSNWEIAGEEIQAYSFVRNTKTEPIFCFDLINAHIPHPPRGGVSAHRHVLALELPQLSK